MPAEIRPATGRFDGFGLVVGPKSGNDGCWCIANRVLSIRGRARHVLSSPRALPPRVYTHAMGLMTFSLNLTLDGCIDHRVGIADDETHAYFTGLMDRGGAMLWGRVTYELMESYWPAVARGDEDAPPAMREWAVTLEAKPKYVVSSTRSDYPWNNSHHLTGDLRTAVQGLKDATPEGVLLGSATLAAALDRLDLVDEYKFLVQPLIAGHGPTLFQGALAGARRLELRSATSLSNGVVAVHYRRQQ